MFVGRKTREGLNGKQWKTTKRGRAVAFIDSLGPNEERRGEDAAAIYQLMKREDSHDKQAGCVSLERELTESFLLSKQ